MRRLITVLVTVLLAQAGPVAAQDGEELVRVIASLPGEQKAIINRPDIGALEPYGSKASWETVSAADVLGGEALRVSVTEAGPDPWSAGVLMQLTGEIKEGDVVFVVMMARGVEVEDGARSGIISTIAVQESSGDYIRVAETSADVPLGQWEVFHGWGRADRDLGPGSGVVSMNIADIEQVIDIGPAVVVNLGPDVDTADMP